MPYNLYWWARGTRHQDQDCLFEPCTAAMHSATHENMLHLKTQKGYVSRTQLLRIQENSQPPSRP